MGLLVKKKKKKVLGLISYSGTEACFTFVTPYLYLSSVKKKISPMSGFNEVIIHNVKTEAIVCKGAAGKAIS